MTRGCREFCLSLPGGRRQNSVSVGGGLLLRDLRHVRVETLLRHAISLAVLVAHFATCSAASTSRGTIMAASVMLIANRIWWESLKSRSLDQFYFVHNKYRIKEQVHSSAEAASRQRLNEATSGLGLNREGGECRHPEKVHGNLSPLLLPLVDCGPMIEHWKANA